MVKSMPVKSLTTSKVNEETEPAFNPFMGYLNMDCHQKVDVFKDESVYNIDSINETAPQQFKNILDFLDSELEVKQVNIKQFLDSH